MLCCSRASSLAAVAETEVLGPAGARAEAQVAAVIVTYHPDLTALGELIGAVYGQVHRVLVVDNASPVDLEGWLAGSFPGRGIELIRLPVNTGIGAAHNRGMRRAVECGCVRIVLFDQDSIPGTDFVAAMASASEALSAQGHRVGVYGPRYMDARFGRAHPFIRLAGWRIKKIERPEFPEQLAAEASYLITSGSMIPASVVSDVGGLDEGLFIEYVDVEWGLRLAHHGYACYGVWRAQMRHSLGEHPVRRFGRAVPLHSPLRHYYHFRNALLLYRRPYAPWSWVLNDAWRLARRFVFYALFAPQRHAHLKMMWLGVKHGLLQRSGPYESALRGSGAGSAHP